MYYIVHDWYRQQQQQCQQKYGGETSEKRRSKTADEAKTGKAVGSGGSNGNFRIYALQMAKEGI